MASKRPAPQEDAFQKALKGFDEDKLAHDKFREDVDRRYRAYRGLLEVRSNAAAWTNKQHPAYILQSIETMVGNLIDPNPKFRLRPVPVIGSVEEIQRLREGARANELLLQHQLTVDKFAEKQRPFALQGLIAGLTVRKQYWEYGQQVVRKLNYTEQPIHDLFGQQLGTAPLVEEQSVTEVVKDDPCSEVVDVRDFIWHEGATSLKNCQRLTHRIWMSMDELRQLEKQGVYGPLAGGESVDQLKESKDFSSEVYQRENDLFNVKRNKDQVEVLECWIDGGKRVVTLGNRKILLSDKPNPFWFNRLDHQYPFAVCSAMPDLFRIPGISEVELMMELQEMLWTLMNQRLDNLQLVNNAIFLLADDVEDPDAFEFAPGERWLVPRPVEETVKPWSPDIRVAEVAMGAEAQLKGDLQNITGGMPFLAGTDQSTLQNNTATGVSIVTTLAQKRLAAKKQNFAWAHVRMGEQWLAMNQQFIRSERLVPVIGHDGAAYFETVKPEMIQGRYSFEIDMVDDSLVKQERVAQAQAALQVGLSAVQVFAIMSQAGVSPALNIKAFMDDYLDALGISDRDRYYSALPQPAAGPQGPAGAPPGQGGGGATNPEAAAGPMAPSNPNSLSGEANMQRLMAMRGGVNNAG